MKTVRFKALCVGVSLALSLEAFSAGAKIRGDSAERAWCLFREVNAPASDATESQLEWETWASMRDVYANPQNEPDWTQSATGERFHALLRIQRKKFKEVRMNRAAFDYVVNNDLYFVEGQMDMHRRRELIEFPEGACHVTVLWQPIAAEEVSKFRSERVEGPQGDPQHWGIAAMHIAAKQSGRWLWTTWEHRDNPDLSLDLNRDASQISTEEAGTEWENYVLVGTQQDFVDEDGRPTLLANSELEIGFAGESSSCITCHARASVSDRLGDLRLPVFEYYTPGVGSVGEPKPEWYYSSGDVGSERSYTSTDFVWSLKRASLRGDDSDAHLSY